MSRDNLAVVRAAYGALEGSGVEAFSEYWSDDIEWRTMRARWGGKAAGRAYLQELLDLFDDFTTEVVDLIKAGDEHVVAYLRYSGRSKRSGVPVPPEYFAIAMRLRDGKIMHAREYATREEAVEAVGLRE